MISRQNSTGRHTNKLCECGCGNGTASRFVHGHNGVKHGFRKIPEYGIWRGIKGRCFNSNDKDWLSYGGRGITVCDEWRGDFSRFLLDVGRRPSSRHQLDRYPDNNGNYEPGNVRWALPREQTRNTRQNIFITYEGETLCVTDWAERLNVSKFTLYSRFRTTGTIFNL